MRAGRVVVRLVLGQDGAQVCLAEDHLDCGPQDRGAGSLEDGVERGREVEPRSRIRNLKSSNRSWRVRADGDAELGHLSAESVPAFFGISQTVGGATFTQASRLAVDPAVPPAGVLAGQPEGQGRDVPVGRRAAGLAAHGPGGPAAADDVAMPAQDRVGDQQPQPLRTRFRYQAKQVASRAGPPGQLRAARLMALQDGELGAQDHATGLYEPIIRAVTPAAA